MSQAALHILKQYWSYDSFREQQEEIIDSVLNKQDTLAVLPTGGGKSICFQVPALTQEGICIVISPLIALMQDQVNNLLKRDIKATAIYSGMFKHEIDVTLDNCVYGDFKLLYVSPERIGTEIFQERLKRMPVNLIAIDEAHCISQWGHDFRPSYRNIATLRTLLPEVPVIALTASATKEVRKDIIEQLELKDPEVFVKSFYRPNLSFIVRKVEQKLPKVIEVCKKLKGSGIVYVRNRKACKEVSSMLVQNGVSSTFYHAGLKSEGRKSRQEKWMRGETRVMVCTNAFGMGIDKSDVRFVLHIGIVDSLEAYYQEAGRAGRDGKKSYAGVFYQSRDIGRLQKTVEQKFPAFEDVRRIYAAICSHFQIAIGNGKMMTKDFDLYAFCKRFNLEMKIVYNALQLLESNGYLLMSSGLVSPSKVKFKIRKKDLYQFQVDNVKYDGLIKVLLRTYGGILDHYTVISEKNIATKLKVSVEVVKDLLSNLLKKKVLAYLPYKDEPNITLLIDRIDEQSLMFDKAFIKSRKEQIQKQVDGMLTYIESTTSCRQKIIANYFGERGMKNCGKCDYCLSLLQNAISDEEFESAKSDLLLSLKQSGKKPLKNIIAEQKHFYKSERMLKIVRRMVDENLIEINNQNEVNLVS